MGEVQQRVLIFAAVFWGVFWPEAAEARKFYDDDPIWCMPKPLDAGKPAERKLSEYYDYFYMTFGKPGEKSAASKPIRAGAVNTLGEAPDSLWYTNRHGRKRMSIEELVRGPGNGNAPAEGAWRVVGVKSAGVTPGLVIKDARNRTYQLKFDTHLNRELSSGADVMGSKFYYAFGYFTPENYIVYFHPERLTVEKGIAFLDYKGRKREMQQGDVEHVLRAAPRDEAGRYRAVASLYIEGKPLGPFRFHGVRSDDPNDIVPHEHRRDLRGLKVFNAWLNHSDSKSLNSHDTLIEDGGVNVIRHYLLDFSAAFGTEAFGPKSPRSGYVYLLDWPDAAKTFFTLGLWVPAWARARYEHVRGAGRMESEVFDPDRWKGNYYNPAFENCLPDDGFWAAKQVMRFTEAEIRALVETAQYTDKAASEHLVRILVERQRKIGREYLTAVLPLDEIRVEDGKLAFEDLGVKYGFAAVREYRFAWSNFDNESGRRTALAGASSAAVPRSDSQYLAVEIQGGEKAKTVTVYLRRRGGTHEVAGIERAF